MTIYKKEHPSSRVDFRGIAGMMLRGKKMYGAGGTSPNPTGQNQWSKAAKVAMKKRGIKKWVS